MRTHAIAADHIRLKRAYDPPSAEDGLAGGPTMATRHAQNKLRHCALDEGHRSSTELRRWFRHDPERWAEFRRCYAEELREHASELDELRELARVDPLTLVLGARDEDHNDAAALRELLLRKS